ncbi:MAG: nicotinate phosphoribosyltransferase [Planctomycetes bacterium]|nr:nicotinate phosphoribosyltransferase [Planctomycetota bacterium]
MPVANNSHPLHSALFTDLYELTMAQAYQAEGMDHLAVFELFFRELPDNRSFIVAAGLDDVLDSLEQLHVTDEDITYLRGLGQFSDRFLALLRGFRFMGDVHAVPEGTIVFPNEPLIQVIAPIFEAQLIETLVLNQIHFQSVVATKSARVVLAAQGRAVIDFGSRRAHGSDAALKVARASYLVGAAGTSNVLAGRLYGIPVFGTMAHSYIQAHDSELDSFDQFVREFPETTLLIDTYDTLHGAKNVIELKRRLGEGFRVKAVRLDSGDLQDLAFRTREMLDAAGLQNVRIFASSGLDEYKIAALLEGGSPIDAFGVGTKMAVSKDATDLDMAYKLVEYASVPRTKLSARKVIYPGRKQAFREVQSGIMVRDVIGRFDEPLEGESLLQPVMQRGARLPAGRVSLENARQHARRELSRLPPHWRQITPAVVPYPVNISKQLASDLARLRAQFEEA